MTSMSEHIEFVVSLKIKDVMNLLSEDRYSTDKFEIEKTRDTYYNIRYIDCSSKIIKV